MTDRDERQYGRYENLLTPQAQREAFADALIEYADDPYGFVMWAFPWGVPGTELEHETGPDEWQIEEQEAVGQHLRQGLLGTTSMTPFRGTTASGHGIGKSAEVAFMILWAGMTAVDTRGVVTANSDTQLRTKTWAELGKWWGLLCLQHPIAKQFFEVTATSFKSTTRDMTWRIDAIPNNPRNPAAFAGAHNAGKRLIFIIDEASEIEDVIWDVVEGALTDADTEIILLVYGNPTKNVGRFKEITVGRMRHGWRNKQIDSRKVKRTNKELLQSWVDAWGEDSDFVRIRVRGVFPRVGSMQLIPTDLVQAARMRQPSHIPSDPLVAGLDVARFGDDASVLRARRGRDAASIPKKEWRGIDLMTLAGDVALWCQEHHPDALFVDIGGLGAGVYDRLIQLRVPNVFPVNFGGRARMAVMNGVEARVADHGAAMWVNLLAWLPLAALPPDDDQIEIDLTSREYGFTADGAIRLESKKDMKKRGLSSPDDADALALTFAMPVQPRRIASSAADLAEVMAGRVLDSPGGVQTSYDPYAEI